MEGRYRIREWIKPGTRIDFMNRKEVFILVSGFLILAGLISMVLKGGLRYGIDFTGGTLVQVRFQEAVPLEEIRKGLKDVGLGDSLIQQFGNPKEILIRFRARFKITEQSLKNIREDGFPPSNLEKLNALKDQEFNTEKEFLEAVEKEIGKYQTDNYKEPILKHTRFSSSSDSLKDPGQEILGAIQDFLPSENKMDIRRVETVGPQISKSLRNKALIAVLVSFVAMFLYISFRFGVKWATGGILAVVHDAVFTLGIFSLTDKEISLPVVAALLTIIGYSINDTIVVFDRIRENLKKQPKGELFRLINLSVNETLSRTILTSFTLFLVVATLFVWGGEVIHDFAFTLIIGVVIGTYSSIFIASPVLIYWKSPAEKIAQATAVQKRGR